MTSGSFRLEQFRVPLMKATVQLPATPLVGAGSAPVDLAVQYLAGGAAADLPVVLRSQIRDCRFQFDDDAYEGFTLANGAVREGVERESESDEDEDEASAAAPAVHSKQALTLDASGTARATIADIPAVDTPRQLLAEVEYRDPNGEVQTAAATLPLWPAALVPGTRAEDWPAARDSLAVKVVVLDTDLQPRPTRRSRSRRCAASTTRTASAWSAASTATSTSRRPGPSVRSAAAAPTPRACCSAASRRRPPAT
ncbi:MAG: hypothetical protein U0802_24205 [Candidatus Binatia bacterium]